MKRANKRPRFSSNSLYRRSEPHAFHFLSQRVTFWVAALSVIAFVTGNMMGQHGWHVFWKSVLGGHDDSLIVYTGTVSPIEYVPDYTRWSMYGGNAEEHTYRQVPKDLLIPMPKYDQSTQRKHYDDSPAGDVFSIGHMGSYETGAEGEGSHPGIDIRVPEGTPVRSIANGIVTAVRDDVSGFGKYVVVRHPRVPDPENPQKLTTIHSVYAHLSATLVSEGATVRKGEQIGLSGKTGFATGPHLHFQIDRDIGADGSEVPWHPYWPFTTSEARGAGMTFTEAINAGLHQSRGHQYTLNPMLYVQSNYQPVRVVSHDASSSSKSSLKPTRRTTIVERREERVRNRKTRIAASSSSVPIIAARDTVVSTSPTVPAVTVTTTGGVEIRHDGSFSGREWENVTLTLLDANGRESTTAPDRDVYLRTAYGQAEFRPSVLSPLDFKEGKATVQMLPVGRTTIVIQLQPQGTMSAPVRFAP